MLWSFDRNLGEMRYSGSVGWGYHCQIWTRRDVLSDRGHFVRFAANKTHNQYKLSIGSRSWMDVKFDFIRHFTFLVPSFLLFSTRLLFVSTWSFEAFDSCYYPPPSIGTDHWIWIQKTNSISIVAGENTGAAGGLFSRRLLRENMPRKRLIIKQTESWRLRILIKLKLSSHLFGLSWTGFGTWCTTTGMYDYAKLC